MVLRYVLMIGCLFSALMVFASETELFHTDQFETNYYFSDNPELQNRLYVGNDVFRFLDKHQTELCAEKIAGFLQNNQLLSENNFVKHTDNTISFAIEISDKNIDRFSPLWKKEFDREWTNFLFGLIDSVLAEQLSAFETTKKGVLYNILQYEKRNKLSDYNMVSKTSIALVLPAGNTYKMMENRYIFTRNNRNPNTLQYTEIILVENNRSKPEFAFPFVNKKSNISDCLALNIIKAALSDNEEAEVLYGVNQAILITEKHEMTSGSYLKTAITGQNFDALKKEALKIMNSSVGLHNLFFYSKNDLDLMKRDLGKYSFDEFEKFLNDLNVSKYIISIPQKNTAYKDLTLNAFNIGTFEKKFPMKQNSIELAEDNDNTLLNQLVLFMHFNPETSLNINGKSTTSEIVRIESGKIRDIIRAHHEDKGEYKISLRKNIGLLRAMNFYNQLVEAGIDKNRIKCNGRSSGQYTPGVEFHFYKLL
jgi:hypothetical protein